MPPWANREVALVTTTSREHDWGPRNMMRWKDAALGALLGLLGAGELSVADAKTPHNAITRAHAHDQHRATSVSQGRHGGDAAAHVGYGQKGNASIYSENLRGRKMADGTPFNPASNAAASKTLSLGTTARVTNLKNGRTTMVKIRDRGPHRVGRIIDVSPESADALGMKRDGVAPVAIAPLTPPLTGAAE